MAWRGVHVSNPAGLSLRDGQMVVAQADGEAALPIEDIAWVMLDTPQVTVSGALLSALAVGGVALLVSDARHHPAGVMLPFHRHHAQAHVARLQAGCGAVLRKRLWQRLVAAKIANQGLHLIAAGVAQGTALVAMARRVRPGDPDQLEAQAAQNYWRALWPDFRRGDMTDRRNWLLDYGYAVVRAALARGCVASGLLPAFGVHHESRVNAFNLADDLIEPFRPVVDGWVRAVQPVRGTAVLDVAERRRMAGVLHGTVRLDGGAQGVETMTLLAASEAVANSLVQAFEGRDAGALRLVGWDVPDG